MKNKDRIPVFTLKDLMDISKSGLNGDPVAEYQFQEASKGGYLLSKDQAKNRLNGESREHHLLDSGDGLPTGLGIPSGKLPNHTTASEESPYSIGLSTTSPGRWVNYENNKWQYEPSERQLKEPGYIDRLYNYFSRNKGNGIDSVKFPNGKMW